MKQLFILIWFSATAFFYSCGTANNDFEAINSVSFAENSISLDESLVSKLNSNNAETDSVSILQMEKVDQFVTAIAAFEKNPKDGDWKVIIQKWKDIGKSSYSDFSAVHSPDLLNRWADINIRLLKISGDVQFGDELEKILYQSPRSILSESQLKSIIYTHIDDQIFVNILGSSSVNHHHTTGGNVKLIQQTNYPESNEMTLKVECGDTRFLDVFIRIPSWAQNPTVQLGNVKYVAHPGEYCEISRKWKNDDQIDVRLKN